MNFSKPLVVLALLGLSTPVLGATTVRGTRSNSSAKENCHTQACCQQHPGSGGCNGSVLRTQPTRPRDTGTAPSTVTTPPVKPTNDGPDGGGPITIDQVPERKNSGHATEKIEIKGTHSNTYKGAAPTPTPKPVVKNINLNSSRSN